MHSRKFLAGTLSASVAAAVIAMTAAPAMAYTRDNDDSTATQTEVSGDLVGTGSDTTQGVVKALSDAYNNGKTPGSGRIISYSATGGGTIPQRGVSAPEITRPASSGQGKNTLYNPDNQNFDFARSSGANSAAESQAGLQELPFAVDTLVMVKNNASPAPSSLSRADVLKIYTGVYKDWSQVPGSTGSGAIVALLPPSSSGTYSFFTAQLTAENGGTAFTYSNTTTAQEHDPTPVVNNVNSIAPFSAAKKATLANPSSITTEPGFSADRAVYNVVRGADLATSSSRYAAIQAAFGPNGYFCSSAAKTIIAAQGFRQLLPASQDGPCGVATQAAAPLITGNVATTTKVTVTNAGNSTARITAAVTGDVANPSVGTVSFYEGSTLLQSGVPLTSTQAVRVQPTTPGTHTYTAVYVPKSSSSAFQTSQGSGSATITAATTTPATPAKATSKVKAKAAKAVVGKPVAVKVKVSLEGSSAKASGKVIAQLGKKKVGKGSLKNGKATIKLKKFTKPGTYKVTITWGGDVNGVAGKAKVTVKVVGKK